MFLLNPGLNVQHVLFVIFLDNRLLETVSSLKAESPIKLDEYVLCDNVDLELVLQEYETFQFVKFRKQPHIVRKAEGKHSLLSTS